MALHVCWLVVWLITDNKLTPALMRRQGVGWGLGGGGVRGKGFMRRSRFMKVRDDIKLCLFFFRADV